MDAWDCACGGDMAHLSTHVLDTASGKPAASLEIRFYAVDGDAPRLVTTVFTNAAGRAELPGEFAKGVYELVFVAGNYYRAQGIALPDPPFLDEITIRFGVADRQAGYHVPLLLAPYGYSTYRGS
jgi:5-hydroxyisourate hydrolase